MTGLEMRGVCRQFTRLRADSNVFFAVQKSDFQVSGGELVAVSGASGSGKSTLLNMAAGILKPTEGTVFVNGKDLCEMGDKELSVFRNRNIGVIPQGQTAIQTLDVLQNVLLPYFILKDNRKNLDGEQFRSRAIGLLRSMGMEELQGVMPSELSGGELRRVAIARGLVMSPSIVLADEPTADLDPENTNIVMGILQSAARDGMAVLVVTHDSEVLRFADRTYSMNKGIIEEMNR